MKMMKEKRKRIEFRITAPQAQNVHLCGSFNNWSENLDLMKKDSAGTWKKIKMLPEGTHEYKFLVDGDWTLDPDCQDTHPNAFGTKNNIIHL